MNSPVLFIGRRFFTAGSRNRLASFIAVLAIAGLVMGVALLIVVLSVMNGFDREMRERILGIVPHIQLFESGGIADWQALGETLNAVPGIEQATPFTSFQAMLNAKGVVKPVAVQGISLAAMDKGLADTLPAETADWLRSGLVISSALADRLKVVAGDRITLMVPRTGAEQRPLAPAIQVFTLAGVVSTHTAEDNDLALVSLNVAGELTGLGARPLGMRIRVSDVFQARELGYHLLSLLPPRYSFIDWFQTHGNLYQAIQMSRQLVGLLIFLIIAIAVFNVISMLVMTVIDKRPAVAILKTLGSDNRSILGIFLVKGTLIGVAGCGLGVIFGVAGALGITDLVAWIENLMGFHFLNAEVYPIDYLPAQLRVRDVVIVVGVALGLNLCATLYPAWLAARVRPVEVLRYE
jgi:lipoprotein-releasing system permease protein